MLFDPNTISQEDIHDLQKAAELAWGDDTRHPALQGHPDLSKGQCLVTARWLVKRLGGFVGSKKGHYFWVSPDKEYIIDLTGDTMSKPPIDPSIEGQLDEGGERIRLEPHHKRWMPGPVVYVRSNNPAYRDFRIVEDTDHDRSDAFAKRADAYMRGGIPKQADLMGPTAYPGETPQKQEDWDNNSPMLHDEPTSMSDPAQEYRFVIANGQLHVSPEHDHEQLLNFAGTSSRTNGPITVGYGDLIDGHITWHVTSNMALTNVHQQLEEFSNAMGWDFDGMLDSQGNPIDDSFGAKKSMWYKVRPDGHLIMSNTPLPKARKIDIIGRIAHVLEEVGPARAALQEWANDFGYTIERYNTNQWLKNQQNQQNFHYKETNSIPTLPQSYSSVKNDIKNSITKKSLSKNSEITSITGSLGVAKYATLSMSIDPSYLTTWIKNNGPYMYHAFGPETDIENVRKVGILPGDHPDNTSNGQWQDTHLTSRPNHVYMSQPGSYPFLEKNNNIDKNRHSMMAKIDLRKLDPNNINPDEDAWIDPQYRPEEDYEDLGYHSWGEWADGENKTHPLQSQFSIESHGSLAHNGIIPPSAFSLVPYGQFDPVSPPFKKNTFIIHAEYPGGSNMLDKMKVMPNLQQHNLGDQDAEPDAELGDITKAHDLKCENCGAKFDHINELILHDKDVHHPGVDAVDQNHFPWPQDADAPLGFGTFPYPNNSWNGLEGAQ